MMQAFLPVNHGAQQPPAVAGEPSLLQAHSTAVMAALLALHRITSGVLQLGASGARTTEANQHWRVALLEDLTEAAGGLAEELEALLGAETAVLSAADAEEKAGLIAAVLAG